jgi:hypothetical protein
MSDLNAVKLKAIAAIVEGIDQDDEEDTAVAVEMIKAILAQKPAAK